MGRLRLYSCRNIASHRNAIVGLRSHFHHRKRSLLRAYLDIDRLPWMEAACGAVLIGTNGTNFVREAAAVEFSRVCQQWLSLGDRR